MNQWRLWLGSGMGEFVSQELAAAMVGLRGRERRLARRLVRRGEVADDVVVARYAVAFARERQRRVEQSSFRVAIVLGVALGLAATMSAVYLLVQAMDVRAVTMVAFAGFFLTISFRGWQERRHVTAAEWRNREYLRRSGSPYVPGGPVTRVRVPPLAITCSLAVHLAVIVLVGGLLTLLLNEEALSLERALSVGAAGGAGAAVVALTRVFSTKSPHDASAADHQCARNSD